MKIALICADSGIAPDGTKGASVHLRALARTFLRQGHTVTAGFQRDPGQPFPVDAAPLFPFLESFSRDAAPDIVYERYSLGHLGGLALARRLDRPFVLEVDAPLVDEARRHRFGAVDPAAERIEHTLWEQADAVVCVSNPLAERIRGHRSPSRPTVVVPNGCDPSAFVTPQPIQPPILAFLGTPRPWHGVGQLVPILDELLDHGREVTLEVIGGGGDTRMITDQAKIRGVEQHVFVTGPLPESEVPARLSRATLLLAPYPRQPDFYFCPLKIIEAQAAGVPVVSTALGDIPELLGDAGMLVAPEDADPPTFARIVSNLLDDPPARRRMSETGRRRARESLSWDRVGEALSEVFARVAGVRS